MSMSHSIGTRLPRAGEQGSTVLAVLGVLTLTLTLVGAALTTASHRFRTSHQSSRWSQAGHAAEAGAEIAMLSLQKNSWVADGWSGAPGSPGAAPVTKTVTLVNSGTGILPVTTNISADKISMNGSHWVRIRSTGIANLAGGAVAGVDQSDVTLRKLSLRYDRSTGSSIATPRATRTVEVLAEPKVARPFRYSMISKKVSSFHTGSHTDSFDSSDPSKSNFGTFGTYGVYNKSSSQGHGDIGTIDPSLWDVNKAHIDGDVLTPTGNAIGTSHITGSVINDFTFTFPVETAPTWASVTQNHGVVINSSKTLTGGTQAAPTRHKFSSIDLSEKNRNISISNPSGQSESWIEVWVTGDLTIGKGSNTGINIAPGVNAVFYLGGNVDVVGNGGGYGIRNGSQLASRLIIRAYGGDSGNILDFFLDREDFHAVVSAPWYRVEFDMPGRDIIGSFLAWQFDVSSGAKFHYDEALAHLGHGQSSNYAVRSWVEAVR